MRKSPWVLVDSGWANQLGLTRTAGVYRIARKELVRKLDAELGEPGICASIHEGSFEAVGTSNWRLEKRVA